LPLRVNILKIPKFATFSYCKKAQLTCDSSVFIKTPDIILSSSVLPVDVLLMVNSTRGCILLIVCDIFLRKEAENHHFGRYCDAKMAVYLFKVIQGY